MELTTHPLKEKYFMEKFKILYSLRSLQPNLKRKKKKKKEKINMHPFIHIKNKCPCIHFYGPCDKSTLLK